MREWDCERKESKAGKGTFLLEEKSYSDLVRLTQIYSDLVRFGKMGRDWIGIMEWLNDVFL